MIESKVYRCEVCGTTYAEKAMCRECERSICGCQQAQSMSSLTQNIWRKTARIILILSG